MQQAASLVVRFAAVAAMVALVGCGRFASTGASPAAPSGSFPSDVEHECGGADAEACSRIVQAAVRTGSVDGDVTAVRVTAESPPSFGPCPSGPCPTLFPDLWAGAVVTLRGGDRIAMNCRPVGLESMEDLPAVRDFPMMCTPAEEANQHFAGVYTKELNQSGNNRLWLDMLPNGGGSAVGGTSRYYGCGYRRLTVPFSFYLRDIVEHAPGNEEGGSGPAGELREVFRSEDIGNREGNLYFRITVLSRDEIRVQEVEPFTVESCAREQDATPPPDD